MTEKDLVWIAFHETIPQLERKIKILEKRIMELEDEEMLDGFSMKAHTKPPKGD